MEEKTNGVQEYWSTGKNRIKAKLNGNDGVDVC